MSLPALCPSPPHPGLKPESLPTHPLISSCAEPARPTANLASLSSIFPVPSSLPPPLRPSSAQNLSKSPFRRLIDRYREIDKWMDRYNG